MNTSDNRAFINHLTACTLVMICLSGSVGLGTVWLRHQISVTANATRRIEAQIGQIERRIADISVEVTEQQSPEALDRSNRDLRLGLVPPMESQIVWVPRSTEDRLAQLRSANLLKAEVAPAPVSIRPRSGLVNR